MDRIKIDPDVCGGKPVVQGTRISVQTVLGYLSAGDSKETTLQEYPSLEPEDIGACLKFAVKLMENK